TEPGSARRIPAAFAEKRYFEDGRFAARDGSARNCPQCRGLRRVCRYWRKTGRACSYFEIEKRLCETSAGSRGGWRYRHRMGGKSRKRQGAHCIDDAAAERTNRIGLRNAHAQTAASC